MGNEPKARTFFMWSTPLGAISLVGIYVLYNYPNTLPTMINIITFTCLGLAAPLTVFGVFYWITEGE